MANDCLPQIQACAMRVARLDTNGVPLPGASNLYVTDALTQVQHAPAYEDGDRITQKNACGAVCVDYQSPPTYLGDDITITLCTPDPQLVQMLNGGTVLTVGAAVGASSPAIGIIPAALQKGVSIELWAKRIRNGDLDPTFPYARWVLPKVTNIKQGGFNQENGPNLPTFTARALENANWFNGPTNDWTAASDKSWQWLPVTTLPTVTCGYLTLAST